MSSTGETPPASGAKERPIVVEKPKMMDFFKPKAKPPPKHGRGQPKKKLKDPLPAAAVAAVPPSLPVAKKQKRGYYIIYKDPVVKVQLDQEVDHFMQHGTFLNSVEVSNQPMILIPQATIRDNTRRQATQKASEQKKPAVEDRFSTANLFKEQSAGGRGAPALLSEAQQQFIASTARFSDEAKNGMTRKELIHLIFQISGSSSEKQCANHLDYLIREGMLPELKNSGRVKTAQATTTKRA